MLTVLTIAAVLIAFILAAVHWKVVREAVLWSAAIASILAFLASVVAFIFAIINLDFNLALLGITLLIACGLLCAIDHWDRDSQFAKWHAYFRQPDKRDN